ncbi:hypothetical protein LJR220_004464 [Bradyrhizobium sp. LjRoot220]
MELAAQQKAHILGAWDVCGHVPFLDQREVMERDFRNGWVWSNQGKRRSG